MKAKTKKFFYVFFGIFIIFIFNSLIAPNGNDEEAIIKAIRSIDGYNAQSIEILEIKDIGNERVVSFLINNHPGYILFTKNKIGNYKWNYIENHGNQSFASFLVHFREEELSNLKFLFVTNKDNEIARVEVDVNGKVFHKNLKVKENSVAWIDLPTYKSAEYKYKYYDQSGRLIEELK